ncbi:MAG: nucleotidyltransferase family protein [Acidobacteria bacterium]|nr:nucleotidyltransferase family protein [Acidobacteriota bacterium]
MQAYRGDFCSPLEDLSAVRGELVEILGLTEAASEELIKLADLHHVTVRAAQVMEQLSGGAKTRPLTERWRVTREKERRRIWQAVEWLYAIVEALELSGCSVSVIKSLDHWPDLGSDLDLYTSGSPEQVISVMQEKLRASLEPRSWGDRLANKWNFRVPGLSELVEVHVRYLGQTGEQRLMAARVLERSVSKTVNGRRFSVPAPEERILISTLQRMYRHFYFRLCDIADVSALLENGAVDFDELRRGAEIGGIWPGVATFLVLVSKYVTSYGGRLEIPREVVSCACSPDLQLRFRGDFLRVPMRPAAGLYGSQLLSASRHRDLRAMSRLPLLPPLALSALVAYRLTGDDKGVW